MTTNVNGSMITVAREERGMSQAAFARALDIPQARLSRYESGLMAVPDDHLDLIAKAVERPRSFFFWNEKIYSASCLYHRKNKRIAVKDLKRIHARVNVLRIQASRLLELAEIESNYSFHRLSMEKIGGPAAVARKLRQLWQLPTGPIKNVVSLIEGAGGIIFCLPFGKAKVDGISQWPLDAPEMPPVFFMSDSAPGDRMRRTLAHEIGHIVMHHLPTDDPEGEADAFASEFLMPEEEIASELFDLTLPKAAALKAYWRVSMQTLIRRARDLKKVDQNRYEYLCKLMGVRGYRTCEPVPIPKESPEMLRELVNVHRSVSGKSTAELSEYLGMLESDFRAEYWQNLSGLRLVG